MGPWLVFEDSREGVHARGHRSEYRFQVPRIISRKYQGHHAFQKRQFLVLQKELFSVSD